mmetsp:Transcript_8756/g.10468  ORF Transcript_8756/g.10468 Transcript_8756/m.10468 type:complete len:121 (-) Transcript_8756:241-603(-)
MEIYGYFLAVLFLCTVQTVLARDIEYCFPKDASETSTFECDYDYASACASNSLCRWGTYDEHKKYIDQRRREGLVEASIGIVCGALVVLWGIYQCSCKDKKCCCKKRTDEASKSEIVQMA